MRGFPEGKPLTPQRVGALYDLSRRMAEHPDVLRVESIVDLDPRYTKTDYQRLYTGSPDRVPAPVKAALEKSVGERIVVLAVVTDKGIRSDEARALVEDLRASARVSAAEVLVTGPTALDIDNLALIYAATPYAVAFILVATYVLLLVQTGSVVIPAKAIVMNVLSVTASFGAMVWIFQQGNLSALLGFTPGPLDPSLPVILFCIVFGLSMDYEVLLLSRMHEEYARTGDNTRAVAEGLERSGRLITGAAAIMVVVFGAFALTSVVLVKALGLGLALAIAVDATLVRALIVPASMRLMGDLNWWAPAPLRRLQARFGEPAPEARESEEEPPLVQVR